MTRKGADWEKLNRIFDGAVKLSSTQRHAFLADACDGDDELRREAEAILNASSRAASQDFLGADAFSAGAKILAISSADEVSIGKTIGNFKVIKEIGRGGMGAIYLAERFDFQQRVALKVIKRGMDTDEILRRFQQEREVLAALSHPNIARLLDGGTTDDGLPFLVMEYVEGSPLTAFADENTLNIDERLTLFRKICSAVGYAHQHLIVHRDLKPSNILVDADGEPKLLDFGIAKLLDPDRSGQTTETGFRMLTPEYASPEQIRGERVTTSSDVYSLGVLLYELLTGKKPYQITGRNAAEIMRVVCETAPERPSSVVPVSRNWPVIDATKRSTAATRQNTRITRTLRGDLDNIILKALQKEPERRYSSVEHFADDIERYLTGQPVTARRATFRYKFTKFVERNRASTAIAAAALIAVLAGSSIAVWQAVVAARERARAERRFGEIRQLANNLVSGWDKDIPETQITSAVRGRIADISSEYISNLANETTDPELLKELVRANIKVGHDYAYASFEMDKAQARLKDAVTLSRRLVAEFPDDLEAKQLLKDSLAGYSEATLEFEPEAIENTRERAELLEQISQAKPGDLAAKRAAAFEIAHYGGVLRSFGRMDEAAVQQRKALAANQEIVAQYERSTEPKDRLRLVFTLTTMAERYARDLNEPETGLELARRAAVTADAALADATGDDSAVINMESSHYLLGLISRVLGDLDASDRAFNTVVGSARNANAVSISSFNVRKEYDSLIDLAVNQWMRGDRNGAAKYLDEAIDVRRRFTSLSTQLDSASTHIGNALLYQEAANVFRRIGMEQRAEKLYRRAVAEMDRYSEMSKPNKSVLMTRSELLLAFGDQLAGVAMCTQNPSDYLDVGRFDRYCPPQDETIRASAKSRLTEAVELYTRSAELTDSLINSGATADRVFRNSRTAASRLAAIKQR